MGKIIQWPNQRPVSERRRQAIGFIRATYYKTPASASEPWELKFEAYVREQNWGKAATLVWRQTGQAAISDQLFEG
jgi:hypothetical protein